MDKPTPTTRTAASAPATPRPTSQASPRRSQRIQRGAWEGGGEGVLSRECGIGLNWQATRHYKNSGHATVFACVRVKACRWMKWLGDVLDDLGKSSAFDNV